MSSMDIDKIMSILPHRYPFLLVDKVLECDDETRIVGIKNVTINEPYFQGHFPSFPIMPGVLQLEAMAQVGGILICKKTKVTEALPLFMAVDKAKFRTAIRPGDQLRIEVEIIQARRATARVLGKIYVDDKVASEAELLFMLYQKKD